MYSVDHIDLFFFCLCEDSHCIYQSNSSISCVYVKINNVYVGNMYLCLLFMQRFTMCIPWKHLSIS